MGNKCCKCMNWVWCKKQHPPKVHCEFALRDRLHGVLGGDTEVSCPCGRIDLLTDRYIIELKRASQWKHALGQLLSYSAYHLHQKRVIYLFGSSMELDKYLPIATNICHAYDVQVIGVDKAAAFDHFIPIELPVSNCFSARI
jgi:hypothetical protein